MIFQAAFSQWIIRNISVSMQNCLQSTQDIKIYRGIKNSSSSDIIVKIIHVLQNSLQNYLDIIKNAKLFYSLQRRTQDLIVQLQHVAAYSSKQHVPKAQRQQDQYCHLYLIRPYFAGRNFHQSVYINSQLPYEYQQLKQQSKLQFHTFIKQSINLMSQIYYVQGIKPTFLPTLQNIYFHGVNLAANLLSTKSILFLKHNMNHISIQNFKHLFPLLKSYPEIFVSWQNMEIYMGEQMLCRSILILWFCFITLRSPIQMVWEMKLNDQQLEWSHLLVQGENNNDGKKVINRNNKIIQLIKQIPKLWNTLLNKPQNLKCFEIFSQLMFQKIQYELPNNNYYSTNKQQRKQYFYKLFQKVFVKQEQFGWKELFQQQEIFLYLRQMSTDPKERQEKNKLKQQMKIQNINKTIYKMQVKTQAMKESFIYVHKYFLYKDIKQMRLKKQQAKLYASRLKFNTYLPFKLRLSIEYTLNYENWFEIFFVQSKDYRAQVYAAACMLYQILQRQCGAMLQHVKFAQFYHVKRVLYILGMKIKQNRVDRKNIASKKYQQTFQELDKQVDDFINKKRPYLHQLKSFTKQIQIAAMNETQKPISAQFYQHCHEKLSSDSYDDLAIFYAAYIKRETQKTYESLSEKQTIDLKTLLLPKIHKILQQHQKNNKLQEQLLKDQNEIELKQQVPLQMRYKRKFIESLLQFLKTKSI